MKTKKEENVIVFAAEEIGAPLQMEIIISPFFLDWLLFRHKQQSLWCAIIST